MFLRKVDGPRTVTLANGKIMSRTDLPPANTRRWVASRKAAVVRAVQAGLLAEKEALEMYDLSADEFDTWSRAIEMHGEAALKATAVQKYRHL